MDIERRIANGVKRVHTLIDKRCDYAMSMLTHEVCAAIDATHERFNIAARSLGQSRRYRNKGENNARD